MPAKPQNALVAFCPHCQGTRTLHATPGQVLDGGQLYDEVRYSCAKCLGFVASQRFLFPTG